MKDREIPPDEPIPGGFHGETADVVATRENILAEAAAEYQKLWMQRDEYISDQMASGRITPPYAELLRSITASTTEPAPAVLHKVKAADTLRKKLKETSFRSRKVAYLGSGYDWQFPVALGARNIEMVDMEFDREESKTKLLGLVKKVVPTAEVDENDCITFSLDLGDGIEAVRIGMVGGDIGDYTPTEKLGGVLEILGPTKGYTSDLVLPNVAANLSTDAVILNFDYYNPSVGEGITKIEEGEEKFYQVKDASSLLQSAQKAYESYPKGPSLSELRVRLKDVKEIED